MYSPPTKENWNYKIKYEKRFTQLYDEGYQAAKDEVLLRDNPYNNSDWSAHFWYLGWRDLAEWCEETGV